VNIVGGIDEGITGRVKILATQVLLDASDGLPGELLEQALPDDTIPVTRKKRAPGLGTVPPITDITA
jgi:hypothetical protein